MRNSSLGERIVTFAIGLGTFTYVQIIGYIAISEILLGTFGVLWLLFNWQEWLRKPLTQFLLVAALWLAFAIVSDLQRSTPPVLYLRGWARVGFLAVSVTVFFAMFRRDPRLAVPYFAGAAISSVISLFALKGGATEVKEIVGGMMDISWQEMSWRDYYNYAFNMVLFAVAAVAYKRLPYSTAIGIAIFGVVNLSLGSRAAGGVQIMAGLTTLYLTHQIRNGSGRSQLFAGKRMVWFLLAVILFSGILFSGYRTAAARGWMGEEQQRRLELQSQSKFGVVVGGRVAAVAGILALRDSPVLGYGSWAEDTGGYFSEALAITGFEPDLEFMRQYEYRRIPTHSHVLEGWVEHGLGGGIFWIAVTIFLFRFMTRALFAVPSLAALLSLLLWSFFWNIPFSPIGNRVFIGASLGLMMAIWSLDPFARVRRPPDRSAAPGQNG